MRIGLDESNIKNKMENTESAMDEEIAVIMIHFCVKKIHQFQFRKRIYDRTL